MNEDRSFPTMIIPSGTEITVNDHGELAIRTPGNLVIQNSGTYSVIECGGGSLRIDPDVRVEAATVKAADTCYVAGNLTAWRVKAKKVVLEKGSQAFIMLRESEVLEMDRQARLVGNFGSEKELYLLMGRFNDQLRHLPSALATGEPMASRDASLASGMSTDPAGASGQRPDEADVEADRGTLDQTREEGEPFPGPPVDDPVPYMGEPEAESLRRIAGAAQERADAEALLQIVAQRELLRPDLSRESRDALGQVLLLLRSGNPEAVKVSVPDLLARVQDPSGELARLHSRLVRVFAAVDPDFSQE